MALCIHLNKTRENIKKIMVTGKNKKAAKKFFAVPFEKRMVFVPHCLRNTKSCKAKEIGGYYLCSECGACKIGEISKRSKELKYKAIYILKGGRVIDKLINELKPQAVLGIACYFEGAQGISQSEKYKVSVQFVPLTKDGCTDTDTDLGKVFKVLEKFEKS
jgi:hypothetical protein